MILEMVRRATDAVTVTILLAFAAAIVNSFVRDWQRGWRPWHRESWRNP